MENLSEQDRELLDYLNGSQLAFEQMQDRMKQLNEQQAFRGNFDGMIAIIDESSSLPIGRNE